MPLDFQLVPVVLGGLDQKTGQLTRAPGKLERAVNVVFDKTGRLNKRRGYQFVDVGATVNVFDDDAVILDVVTHRNELVVITYDYVAGVGSNDETLQASSGDASLIYRGPNNRGNARLHYVSTSRTSAGGSLDT